MSKKVLILHGWQGSDFPHWQSHLAIQLIENNYTVSFPALPNRDLPNLQEWLEYLDIEMKHFKPDVVVCHSLANILWFHYVNSYEVETIEKLMLVAPVSPTCNIPELSTFFPYLVPQDLRAKDKIMACSDNDPYLTIEEAYILHDILGIGLKVLESAGHINASSGFGKLDCAYDWIVR
jgi:predicted alpha/beta hydrolase family esterase